MLKLNELFTNGKQYAMLETCSDGSAGDIAIKIFYDDNNLDKYELEMLFSFDYSENYCLIAHNENGLPIMDISTSAEMVKQFVQGFIDYGIEISN